MLENFNDGLTSFSLVRVGVISSVRIWNNQKNQKYKTVQHIRLQELLSDIPHNLSLIHEHICSDLRSCILKTSANKFRWIPLIDPRSILDWHSIGTLFDTRSTINWYHCQQSLQSQLIFSRCIWVSRHGQLSTDCWSSVNQDVNQMLITFQKKYRSGCWSRCWLRVDHRCWLTLNRRCRYL